MNKEKDIILIYIEDKPIVFARIEKIYPDKKPNWFVVELMLLKTPISVVKWILRRNYINGEKFTMKGESIYFKKIVCPEDKVADNLENKKHDNVIPLFKD